MTWIRLNGILPTRSIIWIMIFTCTLFLYMMRINLSIIILAMVEPARTGNNSLPECRKITGSSANGSENVDHDSTVPDYGMRYSWDGKLQGVMLGAYFWGAVISAIPGGALAERFGPTRCTTISFVGSGLLTIVGPWMAYLHPYLLIGSRFLIGVLGGVVYPCLHCLISRWAPPEEKGKFVGALMGASLGTVLTWPMLGAVIERLGWAWAFYGCGALVLLWTALWAASVSDSPETHKRISDAEKKFIVEKLSAMNRTNVKGVVYPCLHCLISRWAPPEEKGKFVGALMGASLGTVLTWPMLGAVIERLGWAWAFYGCGALVLLWTALWAASVSDSPETHKRISDAEKKFIVEKLSAMNRTNVKKLPPYKAMALSVPFLALVVLHFGNLWGLFFLMTAGPNFMSSVLGFTLGHTGFLASLPYLARLMFGFLFGYVGDVILRKGWMHKTTIRKSFITFSHFLPGILLFAQTLIGCNISWSIVLITLSLGMNGAATITNLHNSQDLAPNYAGTLYGIINAIGSTTGFISPAIVGFITADHNGLDQWHVIFYIGGAVYIGCGIVFCIFGSGDVQPWNDVMPIGVKKTSDLNGVENIAFDCLDKK